MRTCGVSSSASQVRDPTWPACPRERVRDGDGWIVDGQKVWSSLAHESRWGLLLARTDPDAEKHAGITAFIMDMHGAGLEVRPLRLLTGDTHFNEVFFSGVRVADTLRIGEVGHGWEIARTTLGFEHSGGDPGEGIQGGLPGRDVPSLIERYGPLAVGELGERLLNVWIDDCVGRVLERDVAGTTQGRCRSRGRRLA